MARQATKAFTSTRGARFADTRAQTEALRAEKRAAGTARTSLVVDLDDVRDDDEVALAQGGFGLVGETDRSLWVSSNDQTFVRRFVTDAR